MTSCKNCLLQLRKCKTFAQLKQIHSQFITGGLGQDPFILSRLIAFCSDPTRGNLTHTQLLFLQTDKPSLCIRNTMMRAFLLHGNFTKSIEIYHQLLLDRMRPDNYSLPYVLKACANLQDSRRGARFHAHVVKFGFCYDICVGNMLILMYMACGEACHARKVFDRILEPNGSSWTLIISGYCKLEEVEEARKLFDKVPSKDRGIWGSMISGYVQNNYFKEALMLFRLMQSDGIKPDEGALVNALSACAQLGANDLGNWIHQYRNRAGFPLTVRLGTSLVDMYIKCGNLGLARKIFDEMPNKDTICWNVMILGLAMHGDGKGALDLFSLMQKVGQKPDEATFLAVLTACSHSGLVGEGLKVLDRMKSMFHIEPRGEHYGCVVDFLCRAGRFKEAMEIISKLPDSVTASERAIAWRSLLSASSNHRETKLAEVAAVKLFELENVHSGAYVLLSNTYESYGKHEDARRLRKDMRERGVTKSPGCSSIEICGRVHEFVAGKQIAPNMDELYRLLENINDQFSQCVC